MARNKLIIYLQHLCVRDCGMHKNGAVATLSMRAKVTIVLMLL